MEIWRDTTITLNELPLSLARIMPRRWWLLEKEVLFLSEILGYCIHGIQCSVMNIEY